METLETRAVWPVELRQEGSVLSGRFPYGASHKATIAATGKVRKEYFVSRAFSFAIDQPEREIHLLVGHSFNRPLARKLNGSLLLRDGDDALEFQAQLPAEGQRPAYMVDALMQMRAGLVGGLSPGFLIPPEDVVPGAQFIEPEAGNPGVSVRAIRAAVLTELSIVTRPAYPTTELDLRHEQAQPDHRRLIEGARAWL